MKIEKAYEMVRKADSSNKLCKGINESVKLIERKQAKYVIMAEDVKPEELISYIPLLCLEKNISLAVVPSKEELGKNAGLQVPTSVVAIKK